MKSYQCLCTTGATGTGFGWTDRVGWLGMVGAAETSGDEVTVTVLGDTDVMGVGCGCSTGATTGAGTGSVTGAG